MGSGGRKESNSHELARVGEKKIFHEFDAHHVLKVGRKRFCLRRPNESNSNVLAGIREKKIFHESTYIMSRK